MGFAKFASEWGPEYDGIWDRDIQNGVAMQRCAEKDHFFFCQMFPFEISTLLPNLFR
jgi:hypothetical protein